MRLLRTPIYALMTIAAITSTQTAAFSENASTAINRRNFFAHPPTLVRVNALHSVAYQPATYEFTITVPADAGAPLKAVSIVQDRNLETIRFEPKLNKAFAGDRYAAGPAIPLASIGGADTPPGTTTVVFEQPVQPGTTVTVAVDAKANPGFGGIYEFGVTAYPEGDQVVSQFLGYGRIAFQGTGH
jgi:hypothetical protein